MPKFESRILKILASEQCAWRDLVLPSQIPVLEDFHAKIPPSDQRKYQSYLLDGSIVSDKIPLFQVLVMNYRDKSKIVLFGWGFKNGKSLSVFRSNGSSTVDYFEDYFEQLWKCAMPLEFKPVPPTAPQTKKGIGKGWLGGLTT